ncbi:MAG: NAD(P)-dependent oxidoreductase [Phycisphaerae bacterium]|nr:NAD(P)-dependent oxidoreductase [Phycisphaerae bacterium]
MGAPMAANLLRAGYEVHVHNRTKSKAASLMDQGARWHDSPSDLARSVRVILSCVSDSPDVEAVYLGEDGVMQGIRKGTLCVDASTISPETARTVAARVHDAGSAFVDAPVSGGKTGAETGKLVFMVGGAAEDVERARPIFETLGKTYVHCGPVGNGQLTKLCNQILCGLNLLGVCEAVVFARKVGLDPEVMLRAVSGGAAGSWALENLGPRMLRRDFAPMFMIDLQQKDLRIALRSAVDCDMPLIGTALVSQLLTANQAANQGRDGTQALVRIIEQIANLAT